MGVEMRGRIASQIDISPRDSGKTLPVERGKNPAMDLIKDFSMARSLMSMSGEEIVDEFSSHTKEIFARFEQDLDHVPVLVCARNEKDDLPKLLFALSRMTRAVVPVVVDNGSSDSTAEFSRKMGVDIIVEEENPGLVNALSAGFKFFLLGNFVGPVLLTDADTFPNKNWAEEMVRRLVSVSCGSWAEVFGPICVYDSGTRGVLRTFISLTLDYLFYRDGFVRAHGPNSAIYLSGSGEIINYLAYGMDRMCVTGTDEMVRDGVIDGGGKVGFVWSPRSVVFMRGDRYPTTRSMLDTFIGPENRKKIYGDWYEERPEGHPYVSVHRKKIGKY